MSDFYRDVIADGIVQGATLALLAALVLGALCWLIELVARHRIGFYAGFLAIFAVVYVAQHFAYLDFIESQGRLGDPHGWRTMGRLFYAALALITIPLLIFSQLKLHRWSRNRALPTH